MNAENVKAAAMTGQNLCQQCGAPMQPTIVGELGDKMMRCAYCGLVVDVPDEYSITRRETTDRREGGGSRVTVTRSTTITRRDSSEPPPTIALDDLENGQVITLEDLESHLTGVPPRIVDEIRRQLERHHEVTLVPGQGPAFDEFIITEVTTDGVESRVDELEYAPPAPPSGPSRPLSSSASRRRRVLAPPLWMVVAGVTLLVVALIAVFSSS